MPNDLGFLLDAHLDELLAQAVANAASMGLDRSPPRFSLEIHAASLEEFNVALEVTPGASGERSPNLHAICVPNGAPSHVRAAIAWLRQRRMREQFSFTRVSYIPLWGPPSVRGRIARLSGSHVDRNEAPSTIRERAQAVLDLFEGSSALHVTGVRGENAEEALLFSLGPSVNLEIGYPDGLTLDVLLVEESAPEDMHQEIWVRMRQETAALALELGAIASLRE